MVELYFDGTPIEINETLATLPERFRPTAPVYRTTCAGSGSFVNVLVSQNGTVMFIGAQDEWIEESWGGINFLAS